MTDVLDPAAILSTLPNLLPPSSKELRSPHDALAALFHAAMSSVGFRLTEVDDASFARSILVNVLPDQWNIHGPEMYTLRYKHSQSSLEYVMKVAQLGGRTLVNAIAIETDKAATLDIATNDFASPSSFPYDASSSAEPLVHGFISSNRVADLIAQFKTQIIQKLIPSLNKEGYTEENASAASASSPGPRPTPPRPEVPAGIPSQQPFSIPSQNPLEIGRRDLDPFYDQGTPFAPPPMFPRGGDGMIVGPSHPIFSRRRDRAQGEERGPWGGDGYLPPMGAPPGARFDPVGPNIGPFPGMGPLFGGGAGRGSRPPHSYDPDNDEFRPPGSRDMFS